MADRDLELVVMTWHADDSGFWTLECDSCGWRDSGQGGEAVIAESWDAHFSARHPNALRPDTWVDDGILSEDELAELARQGDRLAAWALRTSRAMRGSLGSNAEPRRAD